MLAMEEKIKYLLRDPFWDENGFNNKALLTEADLSNIKNGALILAGKVQEAEILNNNNRIYPKGVLVKEVNLYRRIISARRSLGELDHPDRPIIEFKFVSHLFTDIWWEGNKVLAKIEILNDTRCPNGQLLELFHERKIPIGMSSRGVGSVENIRGKNYVSDDYQLICWDAVTDPSTPSAFADKTLSEATYKEFLVNREASYKFDNEKSGNHLLEEIFVKNNNTSLNIWSF